MPKQPARRRAPKPMPKAATLHALRIAHLRISQLEEERNNIAAELKKERARIPDVSMPDLATFHDMKDAMEEATGLASEQAAKLEEMNDAILHQHRTNKEQAATIAIQQDGMRRQEIEIATLRGYQNHVRETDKLRHGFPVDPAA